MIKNNNLKITYILASVMIITMLSTSIAYAQSPITGDGIEISDVMTLKNIGVILSAFILAAIAWSILGWQKRRRTAKTPIDPMKLLKTIGIGIGVGVLVFVYELFIGDGSLEYLQVTTFDGYKQLLVGAFTSILVTIVVLKKMFPDLGRQTDGIDSNLEEPKPIDPVNDVPPGKEYTSTADSRGIS